MKDEKTTWPEVCKQVGFRDNLYRTCREKIDGFTGFQNGAFDAVDAPEEDFETQVLKSALKVPKPPGTSAKKGKRGAADEDLDPEEQVDDDERSFGPRHQKRRGRRDGLRAAETDDEESDAPEMPIKQILLYGGLAALVWVILKRLQQPAVPAKALPAPQEAVTTPKAA
jgi:hypothetical protein